MSGNVLEGMIDLWGMLTLTGLQFIGQFPIYFALAVGTVVALSATFTIKAVRKTKNEYLAAKSRVIEAKLRQSKTSEVIHNREKLLKNYYKNRLKCANAKIANRYDSILLATRYSSKKLTKIESEIVRLEAKIALAELNNKTRSINKYKAKLERLTLKNNNEAKLKTYVETMLVGGYSLKLTSNSISSNNDELIKKYQLAVEGNEKEVYNASFEKEIYPKIMEIKNEKGELLYRLSDLSTKRFKEFQTHILSELYSKTKEDENSRTPQVYTIVSYDTQYKGKKAKVKEVSISNPEEIREYINNEDGIKQFFTPEELKNADKEFMSIANPVAFLNRAKSLNQNSINYNEGSGSAIKSRYLESNYKKKVSEFNYGGADKYPTLTKIKIDGSELLTAHLSSKNLFEITSTQLKAYATVMLFKRELEGIYSSNLQFETQFIHAYTEKPKDGDIYNPNRPTKIALASNSDDYYNSEAIYATNFTKPGYVEAVFEIAKEMGVEMGLPMFIDTMARLFFKQQPLPEFSQKLDELGFEISHRGSETASESYVLQANEVKIKRDLAEKERLAKEAARLTEEKRQQELAKKARQVGIVNATEDKQGRVVEKDFPSSQPIIRSIIGVPEQTITQTRQIRGGIIKTESNILREEFEKDIENSVRNPNDVEYYGIVISSSRKVNDFNIDLEVKTANRELFEKYMGKLCAEAYYKLENSYGNSLGIPSVEVSISYLDKDNTPMTNQYKINSLSDFKAFLRKNFMTQAETHNH